MREKHYTTFARRHGLADVSSDIATQKSATRMLNLFFESYYSHTPFKWPTGTEVDSDVECLTAS